MKNFLFSSSLFIVFTITTVPFAHALTSQPPQATESETKKVLDYVTTTPQGNVPPVDLTKNDIQAFFNKLTSEQSRYLSEEDEFYLRPKENQSAADYLRAIQAENARRIATGGVLLPEPTVSTNAPASTDPSKDPNRAPLDGPAPRLNGTMLPMTGTSNPTFNTPTSVSFLDQLIPISFGDSSPLNRIFNQLFYLGLLIAVILAIIMIVRGGIEYMTIDAIASKENGKKRVQAALGGLLLAFSAIMILNTINPGLTKLDIAFEKLESVKNINLGGVNPTTGLPATGGVLPPGVPGSTTTPPVIAPGTGKSEEEVRAYFAQNGIGINAPAGTTNMAGLGDGAMVGVVNLKNASGAPITITGGTEPGHATHGVGKSIVDLRKHSTLDAYIMNNAVTSYPRAGYTEYKHANGATYMNEGDHWHVQY